MKKSHAPIRPRAALLIGAAFLATPAFAQETPQQVVPPPIMANPPTETPAQQPAPVIQMAPASPVVQAVPPVEQQMAGTPEQAELANAEPARKARATAPAARATREVRRTTATTARAAPAQQTAPAAPVATNPAPPVITPPMESMAPVTEADPGVATTTTEQTSSETAPGNSWLWLIAGALLMIAGLGAYLLLGRRRDAEPRLEPYLHDTRVHTPPAEPRVEPVVVPVSETVARPLADPTDMAPLAPRGEVAIAEATAEELTGVADEPAPVSNRPWLEFGLRPVRAGTSEDEALVDLELTVGNAGDTPARDVRISAFMLADAEASEMESMLVNAQPELRTAPVTLDPGDGTRLDAQLAVPKGELGRVFNPVVVAEARYTLPDGREGHTTAAFKIGRPAPDAPGVGPIGATRPHMVENVEAELLGKPEHA